MESVGRATRVTIMIQGVSRTHGKQTHVRILEKLKSEGASSAAVFRAVAAIGTEPGVQLMRLAEVVPDLPMMIVWTDDQERVNRILPHIRGLMTEGVITLEIVTVERYRPVSDARLPSGIMVDEVMTRDVVTAQPETPMSELVAGLVTRKFRALPIMDEQRRVVGIVTNGDLVQYGVLPVRLGLLQTFDTPALQEQLARLSSDHREAREIMSSPVVTATADMDVRQAAQLMRQHKLKRLPVVDLEGRLVGIVSRLDLLRTMTAQRETAEPATPNLSNLSATGPVGSVMTRAVPAVGAEATLPEVINVVASTRLHRAVVVDGDRHVLGLVSGSELLSHVMSDHQAALLTRLMRRVPFVHGNTEDEEVMRNTSDVRARDIMSTDVVVAREDESIRDVLAAMLDKKRKIVPVIDRTGQLVGMVDRADLLGGLLR